jgi:hypothetical protein
MPRRFAPRHRDGPASVLLTALGCTMPLWRWSVATGLSVEALRQRLRRGWEVDRVVTTPLRGHRARGDML